MNGNQKIIDLTTEHVTSNYGRFPVALVRGSGMTVWDRAGKAYLDFVAGVAVDNLGHCHPQVVRAIREQAGTLMHVSNLYHIEPQALLAQELTRRCFGDKAFFCNSGTEANEAAIKLARRYAFDQGNPKRYEIITTLRSFHGRTLGALSATGQEKMQHGFGPMVPGFRHVPFDDYPALEAAVTDQTCAIMLEPIQGETGVILPRATYLKKVRKLCNRRNLLLILDEVQTGFGRTGTLFAHEGYGIQPDIMTLAKGLGGGIAIGAMIITDRLASSFGPGSHGCTFGGNPLACAAALASLKVLGRESFLKQVQARGAYFLERLKELAAKHRSVRNVRGRGLILALDLDVSSLEVARSCLEQGLLVNSIAPGTLRFVPPLIVTRRDIDTLVRALSGILAKLEGR